MTAIPILLVDSTGRVSSTNPAAADLLGMTSARSCCDLVRARDALDAPICSTVCAQAMARPGAREKDRRQVQIRGRWSRLVCTPLANQTVVTILPDEEAPRPGKPILTNREHQVLELVAEGLTTVQIAKQLQIRPATVRTHVEHVREKLGARTRAEAVARIRELRPR